MRRKTTNLKHRDVIKTAEAAQILGYSVRQLERLRHTKQGPGYVRFPSGLIRYFRSEVLAWLNEHHTATQSNKPTVERIELWELINCGGYMTDYKASCELSLNGIRLRVDLTRGDELDVARTAVTAVLEPLRSELLALVEPAYAEAVLKGTPRQICGFVSEHEMQVLSKRH